MAPLVAAVAALALVNVERDVGAGMFHRKGTFVKAATKLLFDDILVEDAGVSAGALHSGWVALASATWEGDDARRGAWLSADAGVDGGVGSLSFEGLGDLDVGDGGGRGEVVHAVVEDVAVERENAS